MRFSGEFKLDGVRHRDDAVDPYTFGDIMDIDIRKGKLFDFVPGTMLVSDRVAEDKGWQVGQRVKLAFPRTGDQEMEIVAVYHDDALFNSGYIVTLDDFGAVLGLAVGAFFGWAAVQAMGSIGVDRVSFPAFRLIMFVVVAGLAGVIAAIFPARRAAKLDVLRAIAHQ